MARKRKGATQGVPDKAHINLIVPNEDTTSPLAAIAAALLLTALVAAFAKFGVVDVLASVDARQDELAGLETQLAQLQGQLGDYASLKRRYESYEAIGLLEAQDLAGASEALALVERFVMPSMSVSTLSLADGVLRMELDGTTLEQVGTLVRTLEKQPGVASATAESASATGGEAGVRATVSVTLRQEDNRGDGADR